MSSAVQIIKWRTMSWLWHFVAMFLILGLVRSPMARGQDQPERKQPARAERNNQKPATQQRRAQVPNPAAGTGQRGGAQAQSGVSDKELQALIDQLPPGVLNSLIGAEIEVEVVGDQIFLQGPEEAVKALELIIRGLDETAPQKELEIVTVERRDANELANALEPVLREMLTKENQRPQDEVSIRALSASKILVAALPEDIDFVISVIHQVDEDEEGIKEFEQLVFPVKHRKASDVAAQLKEIVRTIKTQGGATGEQAETQIIANNANNSIMIIAPEEDREKFEKLLREIDVEPVVGWGEVKLTLFPLMHSKASELSEVINNLLTSQEGQDAAEEVIFRLQISKALPSGEIVDLTPINLQAPTRIIPDEGTNALIVATVEENVGPLQELIGLMDGVPLAEEIGVKLFPLRFADAETVAATLQEMFDRGKELPQDPDGSGEGGVPAGVMGAGLVYNIGLHADVRSNTLIFAGRPEQLLLVEKIVNQLDQPATSLKFPLRLIVLEHTDATRIGQIITDLFEQRFAALEATAAGAAALERERVFLSTDIRSNALIISGSEENYREILKITRQLDTKPAKLFDQIRIISLERLAADEVKTQIDELWQRKAELRSQQELFQDVPIIVADERSNAIIVASSVEDYEEIDRLVASLESQPRMENTELFPLQFADTTVLVGMLDELFEGMAGQSETFQAPTLIPDPRSNTLIAAATRDGMDRVRELVKRLDVQAGPMTALFRVYPLSHASAGKLSQRMQELFDSRADGDTQNRTPIVILAEESSNSLVASASRDDHMAIAELLSLLDRPSNIARQFRIFPLKMAKAGVVAEKLDTLFQSQAEGAQGRADAIAVEADERTNSIIVWGSSSEMQNMDAVIARLDTASPAVEMMVRIVQLKQALAEDFATLLTEGLLGEDQGGDDERAVILSYMHALPDGREELRKLLRQDIRVEADPRTNSLMVVAPADSMNMLESMIRDFDRIRPIQSEIRLFPLLNADAVAMIEQLEEIFDPTAAEGETVTQYNFGDAFEDLDFAAVGQALRFAADERTNTIIAGGSEVDLRMVEDLIRYLDAQEAEDRVIEVVQANYRSAQELAAAVQSFTQQEQEVLGIGDDEESVQRQMERQVSIEAVGDEEQGSSSMIVGTSRRLHQQTVDMIRQLDRAEPQVMISVLIAEVSLRDGIELGIEVAGQDLHFSETAFLNPNGVIQGEDFDFVLGTDLGAAPVGLGGVNFTVVGEDFSFLLHALQQNSRLETLSRPILLVRNGEEGQITIADQVPFVESSQLNDTGSTNSVISREDVGIVLTATPHISPDGYVTVELRQELSSFSGENLQLTEGVTSPIFSTREVETNITVRDGETVIIGGLITTREDETENKVPILGDLPLVGFLFRSTSVSKDKAETVIVMTVDVLRTDEDRREMSIEQRDKFVLPDSIRQSPLMEGLRITPEESALGPVSEQEDKAGKKKSGTPSDGPSEQKFGPQPKTYGPTISKPTSASTAAQPVYGPTVAQRDNGA